MPAYISIESGEKHGCYTVLGKSDKKGGQEFYNVRCSCGYETVIGKTRLLNNPQKCRMCRGKAYAIMMYEKRKEQIGKTINGFLIIDVVPQKSTNSVASYLAECTICGDRRVRTISSMKCKHGERCAYCPPNYEFVIENNVATGYLPDGTQFLIDAEDISLVSKNHWYVNGGGYLFRRDRKTREPFKLHRVILGLSSDSDMVVDHINHNKLDNRKCNLRVVTQAENCMNNIQKCSNTIGYTGVKLSKSGRSFISRIEKGGVKYELLRSSCIEDAAQAYNVAADYLFGVGIGYRNHVFYPEQDFACAIIEKIKEIQKNENVEVS